MAVTQQAPAWGGHTQQLLDADPDWRAKGGQPGNCFQCAVATWLNISNLDAVPHFVADARFPIRDGWWFSLRLFAREHFDADAYWAEPDSETGQEIRREITERGLWWGRVLGGGPTVRGTSHAVVLNAADLSLSWDPHPSRAGLLKVEDITWFGPRYDPEPFTQYERHLEEQA